MNRKMIGRLAGLAYLVVVLAGIFSLAYVPGKVTVAGDIAATIANMSEMQSLYRLGLAAFVVQMLAFIVLPLVLYRLFEPVNRTAAFWMVLLALLSVPLSFIALSHKLDALSLVTDPKFSGIDVEMLNVNVQLALRGYGNTLMLASVFWGLWLLPFGWLVFRSGFLPRIFGVLLMLGCFGYLIDVFTTVLWPEFGGYPLARFVTLPASLGEIGICLWLLIFSTRKIPPAATGIDQPAAA